MSFKEDLIKSALIIGAFAIIKYFFGEIPFVVNLWISIFVGLFIYSNGRKLI